MTRWLDDLRARLQLAPQASSTLLLGIVESDASLEEARRLLVELLRITPLTVTDLGAGGADSGPGSWAKLTHGSPAEAHVIAAMPESPLSLRPMAILYNAEREWLRQLAGPLVLVVSAATERAIRRHSPDFFTWVAWSFVLPETRDLAALVQQGGGAAPAVHEPEEDPIRFLHVSDLHLRPQLVKRYDQDRVLRGLVELLERDRASFPLDLIFVTGDLANAGRPEEYALVVELLRKLMEVTGVPVEHVFVVPGNHDVDRDVGRWLLRSLAKDEEAITFFEDAKSRAFHLKKLEAYAESMGALLGRGRPLGLAVGEDAVELVEVRGARLAVASFNSAWFSQGDDDRGKLWLGEPNVNRAGQRVADLEAPFAVALMHHPFDELHESERDTVEHYVERSFDMVVRGHLHKDKTRAIATQRGGYVELAGPAAYQGSQWANGCFLGEIEPRARKVRLRPYAYASPGDGWVLDAKVFPDDEKDGYRHTFVVPEKRRMKSGETQRREKKLEEAVRKAPIEKVKKLAAQLGVAEADKGTPGGLVQQTVKAARAHAEDAVIWMHSGAAEAEQVWHSTMIRQCAEEFVKLGGKVSRDEPRFLEEALSCVGRILERMRSTAIGHIMWTSGTVVTILNTAWTVIDGPILPQVQYPYWVRLVGTSDEPDDRHAVILDNSMDLPDGLGDLDAGLRALDLHLARSGAVHGALVLFGSGAPPDVEPHVEHVTTPAGRNVLLLRL